MTLSLPLPTRRQLAFATVYAVVALAAVGWAYLGGKATGYETVVTKPAYCNTKTIAGCVNQVIEASGAQVVKNSCTKAGKGFACELMIAGTYGPACYAVSVIRAREGFPLVETAAEKPCPA